MNKTDNTPTGYKHTEIGLLPEDWEVVIVDQIADVKSGKRLPLGKSLTDTLTSHPYIRVTDMYNGGVCLKNIKYVPDEVYPVIKNYRIFKDDIFISVAGTLGIVGKIPLDLHGANLTENANKLTNINANQMYIMYLMMSPLIQNVIEAEKTLGAQPKLALIRIRNFKIPLPPTLAEQGKIATALSDVDDYIGSLEKLIEKKRNIKQGAMQRLLTGQTRLIGNTPTGYKHTEIGLLPEDWNILPIAKLVDDDGLVRGPFGGSLKKEFFVSQGYKVYEQRNAIYSNIEIGKYYIDNEKFNELKRFRLKCGDFIVSCSGTIGKIFQIPINAPEGIINQALLKISLNEIINPKYFLHYFKSNFFQIKIIDGTQGGAMKNLVGMNEFKNTLIPLPPTLAEQINIAQTLSDMDSEIEALEVKLAKVKNIKQGMMQKLLTGQIRLVKPCQENRKCA